jgi:hypothetical protein
MSKIETEIQVSVEQISEIHVPVKNWVNLNLSVWKKWDFAVSSVLRTAPGMAIFKPAPSTLSRSEGESPSLILRGNWFYVDSKSERKIEVMSWITYFVGLLLFIGILQAAGSYNGIFAALFFLLMYMVLDGFMFFSLSTTCSKTRKCEIIMPVGSIEKVLLFPSQSILLISWKDDSTKIGLAARFEPDTAEDLIEFLRKMIGHENVISRAENESPSGSPKK